MWLLNDMIIMINMSSICGDMDVKWHANMSKLSSILRDMNTKWHVYYV